MWILWVAAAGFRCDDPNPPAPQPDPKVGDSVRLRGTLGEDVDCRVFRAESGRTYSLNVRMRGYANGAKLCIYGTVTEGSHCITTPTLDVQSVRAWSSCP
jgi:hypothetical protein